MALTKGLLSVSIFLLCLVSFLPQAFAQSPSFYDKEFIVLDARISAGVDLIDNGADPGVEYLIADLFFHPIVDSRLDVLSINTSPSSRTMDSRIRFTWLAPKEPRLDFVVDARVKSKAVYSYIPNKVAFPIGFLPPNVSVYLSETPTVDFSSRPVQELSKELAKGHDDLFLFVSSVSAWVREGIAYNLSTVTSKASKPASWVLQNRQGVCDEITNLFIAILRAQGVPARFVSGLSYTNSPNVKDRWGAHGWAEVYFQGYGWVPVDPTYGQNGWLDPSHIKLKEGIDATEPSTTYEWRSRDVKMGIHPLRLESSVVGEGPPIGVPVSIDVEPAREEVGLGSYDVVIARVANLENSYLSLDLSLGPTEGLSVLDNPRKDIVLLPFERRKLAWVVRVDQGLADSFIYTFPLKVFSMRNVSGSSWFNASSRGSVLTRDDALAVARGEVVASPLLPPVCSPSVQQARQDVPFEIVCGLSFPEGASRNKTLLCADGACVLVPPGSQNHSMAVVKRVPGVQDTLVTLSVGDMVSYATVRTVVLDSPRMSIHDASAPGLVGFDDRFNLSVAVRRESLAMPRVATLTVRLPGFSSSWPVQSAQENVFSIAMSGSDIAGAGGVDVILRYEDDSGRIVEERRRVDVSLKDMDALQSVRLLFNRLAFWVHDHVSAYLW